ncbi:DoxX family protein [Arthrobacter sp. BE255]|uniref:DoxX family protein n=1 Tax=Arthrobacter sp. BE255 TaxID=2817721 RepID=UPI0028576869|nr:DoxX family protein [Arthrobacter sp. BE255]MDR7158111.1 putative membrane protein YphA (DoxX/SURF4 family) [Arthrobacter sp. BE255]
MNIALWIVTAVLALAFLAAGTMKIAQPKAKLAATGQGWVEDFSDGAVKGIGVLEVLAALGLILPALLGVATVLVPAAAVGLVLLMAGAAFTHGRRHETPNVVINLVLAILAAGVALARFGPYGL